MVLRLRRGPDASLLAGGLIVLLGVVLLLDRLYPYTHVWSYFWPIMLVFLGLYIIFRRGRIFYFARWSSFAKDNRLNRLVGDIKLNYQGRELGDVEATNLVGDLTIDLGGSQLKQGTNLLNASLIIGDAQVLIPSAFPLKISAKTLLGDIKFDREQEEGIFPKLEHTDPDYETADKKLFITINGILGDITLRRL